MSRDSTPSVDLDAAVTATDVAPESARFEEPREHALDLDERDPIDDEPAVASPLRWRKNLALFLATVVSVFFTGSLYAGAQPQGDGWLDLLRTLAGGWTFAVPLLAILLFHEFGHYFAALRHRVDASLPFFIPFPFSPFGTMGAVIAMRGRIRSRNALLDIGASGPLAGLAIALPVLAIGLSQSEVGPVVGPSIQEGQSLLYMALKRVVVGPIPEGHDVMLNPVAFAGWTGLFVTALNMLPVGQLDGGHIAYALFGKRQNRYARILHKLLLAFFAYNVLRFVGPVALRGGDLAQAIGNSAFWLVWYVIVHVMFRVSGKDHPPTEPGELSPKRRVVAVATLGLYVLLFMPTPWATH